MKIAWLTPFNKTSAIGKYSKNAVNALIMQGKTKSVSVDILTNDRWDLHETDLRVVHIDNENIGQVLNGYDIAVYNMGNYMEKHALIFDAMKLRNGIVIAHDLSLHEFFRRYYVEYMEDKETYFCAMERLYGRETAKQIVKARKKLRKWNKLDLVEYSLADEMFPYAEGIVVHSNYHANMIKDRYNGKICVLPLLYDRGYYANSIGNINKMSKPTGKISLLTVGDMNLNKRIHSIVEAIGRDEGIKESVIYTVAGSKQDESYVNVIKKLIRRYKLEKTVNLSGYVSDEVLEQYYQAADLVINLRNPALEGGSATLVEQMSRGKAIIVSNTGIYSEMPDDCVIKIDADNETDGLTRVLNEFFQNPNDFVKYGENAKTFIVEYLSAENYGRKLLDFISN